MNPPPGGASAGKALVGVVAASGGLAIVGVAVVGGAVVVVVRGAVGVAAVVEVVVVGGAVVVVVGRAGCDAFDAFFRREVCVCPALAACGREDPQAAKVMSGKVTPTMARARM
jgi:hypothetical protein